MDGQGGTVSTETTTENLPAQQPPADEVTTALAVVTQTNTTITELAQTGRDLAERYRGVVADVTTVKGYEQIAAIRKELRDKVRYPMQDLKKTGSKMLGDMQRQFNRRVEELLTEAEEHERPFHELLTAEDQRKAREKAEREAAEQRRKDGHAGAIAAITRMALDAVGIEDPAELQAKLAAAQEIIVDESYEEFQGQAQQAKDETLRQLTGMLTAARLAVLEQQELAAERERQRAFAESQRIAREQAEAAAAAEKAKADASAAEAASLREQLAEMQRQQEAQRAEQERAARERAEAIEKRIDLLRQIPDAMRNPPPEYQGNLTLAARQQVRTHVANATMDADLYGDRLQEALALQQEVLGELDDLIEEAEAREENERRQRRAAQVQELIDQMRTVGEMALLAVQDGSADVQQLAAGQTTLHETACTADLFGDRATEAEGVRLAALQHVTLAIEQTLTRDRLRAEEEERQRQQEAEESAARALADAKRAHGEELYEMVRRLIPCLEEHASDNNAHEPLADEATALLLRINPAEDFED
jgi:hypothetical protein